MAQPSFGLRWRKLDLHVHTPGSRDYTGDPITPEEFVKCAIEKGLDGIAITDHNSGSWIARIQRAAKNTTLAIFPGVEISANGGKSGVHVMAIFGRDEGEKTVESLLAKLGIEPKEQGHLDAVSRSSAEEVIEIISEMGGLAVLAHADSSKGALADMKGEARTRVVRSPGLCAVELCNYEKNARFLDGSDSTYKRHLATYRASDNPNPDKADGHSAKGMASRYSWFKTDGLSIDALRQCFADPEVRILPDVHSPGLPTRMYPRIHEITVSQGFLAGSKFQFHEGFNSIIGGKGVGKSLLIEVLRFALNQPSHIASIQEDMRGKLNAQLGVGGNVEITLQVESDRQVVVTRTFDGGSSPLVVTDAESGEIIDANIDQLFPILAYSQTEALEISKNPRAQLQLIDALLDLGPLASRVTDLQDELREIDKRFVGSIHANDNLEEKERDVRTISEQIQQVDRALKSDRHDELKKLQPKSVWLDDLRESVDRLLTGADESIDAVDTVELLEVAPELKADAEVVALYKKIEKLKKKALSTANSLKVELGDIGREVNKSHAAWEKHVSKSEAAYKKWAEEQGGDKPQLTATRKRLLGHLASAEKTLKAIRSKAETFQQLTTARTRLLSELEAVRSEIHELRVTRYAEIQASSRGKLELSLLRDGDRTRYLQELLALKKGTNMQESTIRAVSDKIPPALLVRCVMEGDVKRLSSMAQIVDQQASRLIEHLHGLEAFDEVLAMEYDDLCVDLPSIRYKKDDGSYHPLDSISIGQKCTALLIVALSDGSRPVIIDQPEDALDTPSVYDDVTTHFRSKKEHRQFIITTHNSTVAVAGDSDHFQVLGATAKQVTITASGAMDRPQIVGQVVRHLEGGDAPFGLKARKYGR